MTFIEAHISDFALDFFLRNIKSLENQKEINSNIKKVSGINDFFSSQDEATALLEEIRINQSIVSEPDRREYGDFQTNENLAHEVAEYSYKKDSNIEFVLEPTCGKGNFIIAAISMFKALKKVVGVEIYKPYVWKTKFGILEYYLSHPNDAKPEIDIFHGNAFEFDYQNLAYSTRHLNTLVIGNPPWVTNSELGSIDSKNLPLKSNFKKHTGLDAITGKGNFDIGEYIANMMLKSFDNHKGLFAFLIKNSVVKNLIQDQKRNLFRIGNCEKLNIDAKREFNVSVNACLFISNLNSAPALTCDELDFYSQEQITTFGWHDDKFVNSVEDYIKSRLVDGNSTFIWRSGVKHDCSKIMELDKVNGHFINALDEEVKLENELVYGLLKSSDLKDEQSYDFRKSTIITQSKIGQDTCYIKEKYPLTYQYLSSHRELFEKRKSAIYKGKPQFSIFGIGDYSFANFKVAISGLYKSTHFTLVHPKNCKPVMLDDTCYFIGFEKLEMARIAQFILNSDLVQMFMKSIIFSDSKRSINKDILMRIDIQRAYELTTFEHASEFINDLNIDVWEEFGEMVKKEEKVQISLF